MKTSIRFNFDREDGTPYEGAIIKMYLDKPFVCDGVYVPNREIRDYSNSYGIAELEVVPSTKDPSGENYYHLTVIFDRVFTKSVIVPESDEVINFSDLQDYLLPFERPDFLGDSCC